MFHPNLPAPPRCAPRVPGRRRDPHALVVGAGLAGVCLALVCGALWLVGG